MSKLDNIIIGFANKLLDGKQETLGDYIDPTKEQVKTLILDLIDGTMPVPSRASLERLKRKVADL